MAEIEKVQVSYRFPRDFKDRLEEAARKRGISVTSYVIDRLCDPIEADLLDLRERLDRRCAPAQ